MALIAAEVEGPVTSVLAVGSGAEIVVLGVTVVVDPNLAAAGRVRTPTAKLTIAQLADATPLPGRTEPGFRGGTIIARGNFNTDTGKLEAKLQPAPANQGNAPFELFPSIEIEPSENVLIGPVTKNEAGKLTVNGVAVTPIPASEARLPGRPVANEFGFAIRPETIPEQTLASAEGYFSATIGEFFAHTLTIDGPAQLMIATPQVSVTRAQGRNRGAEYDLEVRGGFTQAHVPAGASTQDIRVFREDPINGAPLRRLLGRPRVDVLPGPFGRYRFRDAITAGPPPYDKAPRHVVVVNFSDGAGQATAEETDVEIIKE
jgi:hypothetical protein